MEILKVNPIIDPNYCPSSELQCQDYFNRAMVFAQTNYQEQLTQLTKVSFRLLTPTIFLSEYFWTVLSAGLTAQDASRIFPQLSKDILPYYYQVFAIFHKQDFPAQDDMLQKSLVILPDLPKCQALWRGAQIVFQGATLFGWDRYRNNFLCSVRKLQALPYIDTGNSQQLARDIGVPLSYPYTSGSHLDRLASRWGFSSPQEMCQSIEKRIVLRPQIIGQILWYASNHFEHQ